VLHSFAILAASGSCRVFPLCCTQQVVSCFLLVFVCSLWVVFQGGWQQPLLVPCALRLLLAGASLHALLQACSMQLRRGPWKGLVVCFFWPVVNAAAACSALSLLCAITRKPANSCGKVHWQLGAQDCAEAFVSTCGYMWSATSVDWVTGCVNACCSCGPYHRVSLHTCVCVAWHTAQELLSSCSQLTAWEVCDKCG
jgi:hypothetical protein